jgi:hypothetical protein
MEELPGYLTATDASQDVSKISFVKYITDDDR